MIVIVQKYFRNF